jgi:hypothetical protein
MSPARLQVATKILGTELVPIDSIKRFPGNPRRGNVALIRGSLRANAQYKPLTVRKKTQHILAGNHTWEAAKAEGFTEIWVTWIQCDDDTARRIVAVDNRSSDVAGWDDDELAILLGSLPSLEGTGFDDADLAKLINDDGQPSGDGGGDLPASFDVLVSCESEEQQTLLMEQLTEQGLKCRSLVG